MITGGVAPPAASVVPQYPIPDIFWTGIAGCSTFLIASPRVWLEDAAIQQRTITIRVVGADQRGSIEILEKFWHWDDADTPGLAPPLMVYADLMVLLDPRAQEAAELIKERYIDSTRCGTG